MSLIDPTPIARFGTLAQKLDNETRVSTDHVVAPFAAFIAHELRTPLAAQRALLELSLSDLDADAAAWREIARDLLDTCKQQEQLLETCLALSRSQAGLGRREIVDIASLAAELLRTMAPETLAVRGRLEPARTTGVPSMIQRLLDNLLANAVRHNRKGGWIALTTESTSSHALVTIENSGPRVRTDELARLFQPFEQLTPGDARSGLGLGLGLAVVKAVADAHGALITTHARPRGGLRVEIAFVLATSRSDH